MKRRLIQPILAIVGLIVSIATATLCVFAWFTTNQNITGAFSGSTINPAVRDIKVEAYLLDETSTGTYTVGNRLGDRKPVTDIQGDYYAMRSFGSTQTTAIFIDVELTLIELATITLIAQGSSEYETVIPAGGSDADTTLQFAPNLSEALEIYSFVLTQDSDSDNSIDTVTVMATESTTHTMVSGETKVDATIYQQTPTSLNPHLYFVMDYNVALMNGIFQRIEDIEGSGSSISVTLNFVNDITFIASGGVNG